MGDTNTTNDEKTTEGNITSPEDGDEDDEEERAWTREEMEEAAPYPMPEVSEDDLEKELEDDDDQ